MDTNKEKKEKGQGILAFIRRELSLRREDKGALVLDILIFLLSFFFAKRHIAFGTYPLGITLVGVLNRRVLIGALGAALGALSLGEGGTIYALMIPFTVILRLLLSLPDRDSAEVFSEPYVKRVFSVAIATSLVSLYEILREGPTLNATLFASCGLLLSVGISISLFGAFTADITYKDILYSGALRIRGERELIPSAVFYHASMLLFLLLSTLSFDGYSFFGITLSHLFVSAVTILVAVRFGVARSMLVGFVSALSLGGVSAVGFALSGLAFSLLFHIGAGYAILGSTLAIGVWCGYVGGLTGFLSVFPEFAITASLMYPYARYAFRNRDAAPEGTGDDYASGSALSFAIDRVREESRDDIAERMKSLAGAIRRFSSGEACLEFSEYRNIIIAGVSELNPTPCEEKIDALASKFYKGNKLTVADIVKILGAGSEGVAARILALSADYERECYMNAREGGLVGEYERLVSVLREQSERRAVGVHYDKELEKIIKDILSRRGVSYKRLSVIGQAEKHIIIIAEDSDGGQLSDKALYTSIEERLGRAIRVTECKSRFGLTTLIAKIAPLYSYEYGVRTLPADGGSVSGDTARLISTDTALYAVLSDGIGKGGYASSISTFSADYLISTVSEDISITSRALSTLSSILRHTRREASATADIMALNLYTGKGYFLKCGAVSSFVKRGNAIIDVPSGGAPLGLVGTPVTESLSFEFAPGDVVVMLTDGAIADIDLSAIKGYLKGAPDMSAEEYATGVLNYCLGPATAKDDTTVLVLKILPYEKTP